MKKFTLIEQDRYIGIDDVGIFFDEDKWPFVDIEHLWAIQWRDNGTEDGDGWIEYDSPIPNTFCVRSDLKQYIDHFDEEYERQMLIKREREEEESKKVLSWQDAMRELEEQMEEMQKRHEENIESMKGDHDYQIQKVHDRVAEAHENLFYSSNTLQDNIEESKTAFQSERGYDNVTVFDGSVDPSLFDDAVDESFFNDNETGSLLDTGDTQQLSAKLHEDTIKDFSDIDLSVLDSEFNLELLFEEDPTEQVVNEIEELIEEVENEEDSTTK